MLFRSLAAAGKFFLLTAAGLHFVIAGWRTTLAEKELWNQKTADDCLFFSDLIRVCELVINCSIQLFETSILRIGLWSYRVFGLPAVITNGRNLTIRESCLVHELV